MKQHQDKIKEICTVLRQETLEPAKLEAQEILHAANERAREIVEEAEREAQKQLESARKAIEQERMVFQTALEQAANQALEAIRQRLETSLFNPELSRILDAETARPDVIARLINAIVKAIESEGISTDVSALVPKAVSVEEVNRLLLEGILEKLKEKSAVIGNFSGGVKVQLHDKKLTIDVTNEALKELLTTYIRKDFRKLFFAPCFTTS
jgi:V/A-type H+/Na+-transporting ATPase subunit E